MLPESQAESHARSCNETISQKGFRFTAQRREVFDALQAQRDHPTAVDVFMRVQKKLPGISLATVYNCLETLTECGLVRAVHHDRQPSRYCANLEPHAHFFCEECGAVHDVPPGDDGLATAGWQLPQGATITHHEISFRGQCAECAAQRQKS
ncbi:MAG TPA: transcriptional repressor [Chthoniobacteraceae bacterium]|jgi:Fur family peroxide stress response transcriptional regulator|nr:transcriptional repressor [Chthoniobacteraceae bacterium]